MNHAVRTALIATVISVFYSPAFADDFDLSEKAKEGRFRTQKMLGYKDKLSTRGYRLTSKIDRYFRVIYTRLKNSTPIGKSVPRNLEKNCDLFEDTDVPDELNSLHRGIVESCDSVISLLPTFKVGIAGDFNEDVANSIDLVKNFGFEVAELMTDKQGETYDETIYLLEVLTRSSWPLPGHRTQVEETVSTFMADFDPLGDTLKGKLDLLYSDVIVSLMDLEEHYRTDIQ